MRRYSNDKDFNVYIRQLLGSGDWTFVSGGRSKHNCLIHRNGRKCAIPCTPAKNVRGLQNFRAVIRRIAAR